ncbi:unnamed protein product [Malus baccata var. baccata]
MESIERSAEKNQKTTNSENQDFDAIENDDVQRGFGCPSSPIRRIIRRQTETLRDANSLMGKSDGR